MYAFIGGGSHPYSISYGWTTILDYSGQEAQGRLLKRVADGSSYDNLTVYWDGSDPHDVVIFALVGDPRSLLVDADRQGVAGTTFPGSTLTANKQMSVDDTEVHFWWSRNASSLPTFSRGSVIASNSAGSCRMSMAQTVFADETAADTDHTTTYPSASGQLFFTMKFAVAQVPGQEPWSALPLTPGVSTTLHDRLLYDSAFIGEPAIANKRTIWFRWTAPSAGEATVDTTPSLPASADAAMNVYTGPGAPIAYSDLVLLGSADDVAPPSDLTASYTFNAVAGTTYFFQVSGYSGAITDYALHMEFTGNPGLPVTVSEVVFSAETLTEVLFVDPVPSMLVVALETPSIYAAPSALSATVDGAYGEDDIVFSFFGEEAFRIEPDPDGSLDLVSVPVPDLLDGAGHHRFTPGSHLLTATQGSASGTASFEVLNAPDPEPTTIVEDVPPVPVAGSVQPNGVIRWVFQDLMPGGLGSWVLPMNPTDMGSPAFSRALKAQMTTASEKQGGQYHITEDAFTPVPWNFKGVLPNEAMREKMEQYFALERRWYLHDHRGRAWKVVGIDPKITPRLSTIWNGEVTQEFHDYDATVVVTEREWVDLYA